VTKLQEEAVEAAALRLKNKKWFRGVCLDNLPDDEEIERDFNAAVDKIIMETQMWECGYGLQP